MCLAITKSTLYCEKNGGVKFGSMLNRCNFLYKEDEKELILYLFWEDDHLIQNWKGDVLRDKYTQTVKEKYV